MLPSSLGEKNSIKQKQKNHFPYFSCHPPPTKLHQPFSNNHSYNTTIVFVQAAEDDNNNNSTQYMSEDTASTEKEEKQQPIVSNDLSKEITAIKARCHRTILFKCGREPIAIGIPVFRNPAVE
jgi:hypothetical protein